MAKQFSQTYQIDLPISQAIPKLSSREFLSEIARMTEASTFNIEVSNSHPKYQTFVVREFSLEQVAALAKLAGPKITITEQRDWKFTSESTAIGEYQAETKEQPIKLTGQMTASENSSGNTDITFELKIVCKIPLFGSMVESQAAQYLGDIIELELGHLAT